MATSPDQGTEHPSTAAVPETSDASCEQDARATDTVFKAIYQPSEAFLTTLDAWRTASSNADARGETEAAAKLLSFISRNGLRNVDVNGVGDSAPANAALDTAEAVSVAALRAQLDARRGSVYTSLGYLADIWTREKESNDEIGYCPMVGGFVTVVGDGMFALTWKAEDGSYRLTRLALVDWQQE